MAAISDLKVFLSNQFKLRDLGDLTFFLGLEVARSRSGIFVSQQHYMLQLLEDCGMLAARPKTVPIRQNHRMARQQSALLTDPSSYQ